METGRRGEPETGSRGAGGRGKGQPPETSQRKHTGPYSPPTCGHSPDSEILMEVRSLRPKKASRLAAQPLTCDFVGSQAPRTHGDRRQEGT